MIKSYTDLEQSKRLIELGIDVNTADMCWCIRKLQWGEINKTIIAYPMLTNQEKSEDFKYIPAWSLTALLGLIPNWTMDKTDKINLTCNPYYHCEVGYNDFIDAAFEMIVWLKENEKI